MTPVNDESGDVEAQNSKPADAAVDGEENVEKRDGLRIETMAVLAVCVVMICCMGAAMGLFSSATVLIAGAIAIVVGFVVAKFQYFDLESLDTLRTIQNKLRSDVNVFSEENTKLTANNDRLEAEIAPLKECEAKLSKIAEENGADVNKLKNLVEENQKTLDAMHEAHKQDVVHSMMQILMEVDRDEDGDLSERETKRLLNKMRNLPTVALNEERFTSSLQNNRRVSYFLDLVHQVNDDDVPEDERIFTISEEAEMGANLQEEE